MSITIRKLNADTTFLLTFSTTTQDSQDTSFNILFDPWLQGQSSWIHPAIQASDHTIEPAIASLSEIEQNIDLIIVSQDKPDHCHRKTLCSWPKEKQVQVLAAPAAARKIREWKHFEAASVLEMPSYIAGDDRSLTKIKTSLGQISVANLASRKDLTGLHNAVGVLYRASAVDALNITPPESPSLSTGSIDPIIKNRTLRARVKSFSALRSASQRVRTPTSTPPSSSKNSTCVSCIYSPHGVAPSLVQTYLKDQLEPLNALPVTLLLHGMNMEQNPWYMGGIVASGTPGGLSLIKTLGGRVQNWISAHDEAKDNRGFSVRMLKSHKFGLDDIRELLDDQHFDEVQLRTIEQGQSLYLSV